MPRVPSLEEVNEAIEATEHERAMRLRVFAKDLQKRDRKIREMDGVLDVLRWSKRLLLFVGAGGRNGRREERPMPSRSGPLVIPSGRDSVSRRRV